MGGSRMIRTVVLAELAAGERGAPLFTHILDTPDKQTRQKRGER